MNKIFVVFKCARTPVVLADSGETCDVALISSEVEVSGTNYATGLGVFSENRFGYRNIRILNTEGVLKELGQVGSTSEYLYMGFMDERVAGMLKHKSSGLVIWTLQEYFLTFDSSLDLSQDPVGVDARSAWPSNWYRPTIGGGMDLENPYVRIAPSSAAARILSAAQAKISGSGPSWLSLEQTETFILENGTDS